MQTGLYQHYKGNLYHVMCVGRDTESLIEVVVYRGLYGDYGVWVRPKAMFEETIEYQGKTKARFTFIRPLDLEAPAFTM